MRKIILFCISMCLVFSCLSSAFYVSAEDNTADNTVVNGAHSVDAMKPLLGTDRLVNNVQTAIVYETKSETLMHAFNADEQIYPASLVKILTALLVIEKAELSNVVTINESTLSTVASDAVTADLVADEVMTVEDLLYCMMVGSANDAAAVLAEHVSGSQSAFVEEMNAYATELGCKQTTFTNVHGLHDELQVSTTRDMARILAKALGNETFCEIFGAVYYKVPATNLSEERSLSTGNYLMNNDSVQIYHDSRVTGGRTAVTSAGYRSIATSAEDNGMQLVCIITGAQSVYKEDGYTVQTFGGYNETSFLLNSGFEGFEAKQVVYAGQAVNQYAVVNGTSDVVAGATDSVYTVLPAEIGMENLDYRIVNHTDGILAPVEKGQVLSGLEVWYENICVAHVDLCALNAVPVIQNQTADPAKKSGGVSWKSVFITVLCIAAAVAVLWVLVQVLNRARRMAERNHSRQHRRNRRRSR